MSKRNPSFVEYLVTRMRKVIQKDDVVCRHVYCQSMLENKTKQGLWLEIQNGFPLVLDLLPLHCHHSQGDWTQFLGVGVG